MLRKLLLVLGIIGTLVPFGVGCSSTEPVLWSWPHYKRHITTTLRGFHRLHMDVDRIIFDMEEYPAEAEY